MAGTVLKPKSTFQLVYGASALYQPVQFCGAHSTMLWTMHGVSAEVHVLSSGCGTARCSLCLRKTRSRRWTDRRCCASALWVPRESRAIENEWWLCWTRHINCFRRGGVWSGASFLNLAGWAPPLSGSQTGQTHVWEMHPEGAERHDDVLLDGTKLLYVPPAHVEAFARWDDGSHETRALVGWCLAERWLGAWLGPDRRRTALPGDGQWSDDVTKERYPGGVELANASTFLPSPAPCNIDRILARRSTPVEAPHLFWLPRVGNASQDDFKSKFIDLNGFGQDICFQWTMDGHSFGNAPSVVLLVCHVYMFLDRSERMPSKLLICGHVKMLLTTVSVKVYTLRNESFFGTFSPRNVLT